MRLSEWRATAPSKDAVSAKVLAVLEPVLESLGAGRDPECWVHWGDDPGVRWTLLAPTLAGLVEANVRVSVPGEGPRVAAKLVRWSRVQIGDLAVESQGGHRFVSLQVEGVVLRGIDAEADRITTFVRRLLDAADGRGAPETGKAATAVGGRRGRSTPVRD